MADRLTRRDFVATTGILAGGALLATQAGASAKAEDVSSQPFVIGLNTGTIRGYKLPFLEQVDLTAGLAHGDAVNRQRFPVGVGEEVGVAGLHVGSPGGLDVGAG